MLSLGNRLKDPELFRLAMRKGVRAGNHALVAHVVTGEDLPKESLVGFVVPKKVFLRAHERNQAKRRLRHLMRGRLEKLPAHSVLVIRVLPGCKDANFAEITNFLDSVLDRALEKLARKNTASVTTEGN
ncbi:ribonuclease P protein component [Gleimia sp. 6138-11-ORH1]|uniref:ribonuclease P protein component n=1 Tax=Gleimia sp. 6138-11-ORH1 TaxID=2973937 RepID=UPI0021695AE2|nr:ribonuclease P protein component [Gleimia sp. 6138-11-ORH1]MCS4485131.1 ribonuclease P protein component [Gleimia sp. 6138-11-ORH1]